MQKSKFDLSLTRKGAIEFLTVCFTRKRLVFANVLEEIRSRQRDSRILLNGDSVFVLRY